jgi:3-oxoacyl-[acyl-carrier protein] reductase
MSSLEGNIALVTGASRGIGKAIAEAFAARGARLILASRSLEGLEAVRRGIESRGGKASALAVDMASVESVAAALASVEKQSEGRVDVLVNNAGITRDGLLLRMSDEDWQAVLDTNLTGAFRMTRGVLRGMVKNRYGRIINVSSVVGEMGNAGQANYAASKAGLIGFTKSLAREVAARGITVNAIAPGYIETDMTSALNDKAREALKTAIPAGRLGTPDDVAHAACFLASREASYVTGQVLHVGGGMYM